MRNIFEVLKQIEEICDNYINLLREYLDEDRTRCDMELIENFEALKEDLLEGKQNGRR